MGSCCSTQERIAQMKRPPFPLPQGPRRALSVAINYLGYGDLEIGGSFNNQDSICKLWIEYFNVNPKQIRRLRDDSLIPENVPTKENILLGLQWLLADVQAGEWIFCQFSGHGSQILDRSYSELDGKDEAFCPLDFKTAGKITDDEMRQHLVRLLPQGAFLFCIADCCNSGTILDLRYQAEVGSSDESVSFLEQTDNAASSEKYVLLLSACKDNQFAEEAKCGVKWHGALSLTLFDVLRASPGASLHQVFLRVRALLKERKFKQLAQLSAECKLDLNNPLLLGPKLT